MLTTSQTAMTRSRRRGSRLVLAGAAAICVVGGIGVPLPAQAAPACGQYAFNGNFSLKQSNGDTVVFSSIGPVASGNATATGGVNGPLHGTVTGGIQGDKLDFQIVWNVNSPGTTAPSQGDYRGYVSADGFVHGDTAEHNAAFGDTPRAQASWDSTVPLVCSTPAAAPAPPPPDTTVVQKAPGVTLPDITVASSPAAPAPPKTLQGPTVSATPGLTGVTFHVTDRSGVASHCTYSSEGFTSNSFALPANGSFDLFVAAIREFRTRTGTITCDNGTSAPTSVNF